VSEQARPQENVDYNEPVPAVMRACLPESATRWRTS